jgi:predicted RNase H-like nuclease
MERAEAVTCLGLDLAWSARNATGAAALRLDTNGTATLTAHDLLLTDDEIAAWVAAHSGSGAVVVAVDAPLLIPNETGRREADAAISARFARFHAGAHPANRKKLAATGTWRGDTLRERLSGLAIQYAALVPARSPGRWVVEVYPHPATITLFGLDRILPYKAKAKYSKTMRFEALHRFLTHLQALQEPAFAPGVLEPFAAQLTPDLRGKALKSWEDRLDALMCAYIAAYAWWWGPERTAIFGDPERGSILVPMPPAWATAHPSPPRA